MLQNSAVFLTFLCLLTAGLFFELTMAADMARLISYGSFAFVVLLSLKRPHILPLLVMVLVIKLLQVPISLFLKDIDDALLYYLSSALLDLLMAFFIVHYHNDEFLLRKFKAQSPQSVPQVFLMAGLLAISSLVACLQAIEYILYQSNPDLFNGGMPFIYQHQKFIKLTLKTLFEVCIWSLLLDPKRWPILVKIERRFF
jgi:hypothetical protein